MIVSQPIAILKSLLIPETAANTAYPSNVRKVWKKIDTIQRLQSKPKVIFAALVELQLVVIFTLPNLRLEVGDLTVLNSDRP